MKKNSDFLLYIYFFDNIEIFTFDHLSMEWASETGGSVIEFHLYTWSQNFDPNTEDSKVWELISPTVKLIYPEIFDRNFKVSKNLFFNQFITFLILME